MRRTHLMLVSLVATLFPFAEAAACGKDTDCKGDRVCEEGRCVAPAAEPSATVQVPGWARPAAEAPAASPAAETPRPFSSAEREAMREAYLRHGVAARATRPAPVIGGYFEGLFFHNHSAFAGIKRTSAHSGFHFAGYRAFTNKVHLGGHLSYSAVGDSHILAAGLSLKAGSWIKDRAWLGLALDHGVMFTPHSGGFAAMELSPRLHLDVCLFRSEALSLAATLSVGPTIIANGDVQGGVQSFMTGLVIGR